MNISKFGGFKDMKTKRYLPLTHEMCEQAVLEAFDRKWFRRDYLATVEKYGGVSLSLIHI